MKNKGTEIAEKYIADNPRLSYVTLHVMSDEDIESILKIYLKDDIKCHISEFRHCIQEHLYERFHKLENDIERLYEIIYDFKGLKTPKIIPFQNYKSGIKSRIFI